MKRRSTTQLCPREQAAVLACAPRSLGHDLFGFLQDGCQVLELDAHRRSHAGLRHSSLFAGVLEALAPVQVLRRLGRFVGLALVKVVGARRSYAWRPLR